MEIKPLILKYSTTVVNFTDHIRIEAATYLTVLLQPDKRVDSFLYWPNVSGDLKS